jgi:glycosyltransferase involved in cell wall biosynthesis
MKKSLEIITSAYNEEECLPELFRRLVSVASKEADYDFKFIVIDNGSSDKTWGLIQEIQKHDPRFKGMKMSRNFALDAAFTCGLDHATADAVVIMTSDLQDPPEAIHQLLREFEQGFDQVLARITNRGTVPLLRRKLSSAFYKIANFMTGGMLPESVSDFRLLSKRCYHSISMLRENHRFLRGLGSWVGYRTATIEIERPPRFAGESKWLGVSLIRVILHGFQSIFAYSTLPLAWISIFGVLTSILSAFALLGLIVVWLAFGVPFAGFGSIVAAILLGFSITILVLGVISQYIGLIYEEVKRRPLYLVEEKLGDF